MPPLESSHSAQAHPCRPWPQRTGFAALLASLRPEVLRFACWLARDRALAEDIVQETLLRAWRNRVAKAA